MTENLHNIDEAASSQEAGFSQNESNKTEDAGKRGIEQQNENLQASHEEATTPCNKEVQSNNELRHQASPSMDVSHMWRVGFDTWKEQFLLNHSKQQEQDVAVQAMVEVLDEGNQPTKSNPTASNSALKAIEKASQENAPSLQPGQCVKQSNQLGMEATALPKSLNAPQTAKITIFAQEDKQAPRGDSSNVRSTHD